MLLTAGLSPVAHEFRGAVAPGEAGSGSAPVGPEGPSTTMPFGYLLGVPLTDAGAGTAGHEAEGDAAAAVAPSSLAEQPGSASTAAAGRTSHRIPAGDDEVLRRAVMMSLAGRRLIGLAARRSTRVQRRWRPGGAASPGRSHDCRG